jgi:transposase
VVGGKKTDAVLGLLRGEPLEALSRELGVEAHRLAAWRDDLLESGKEGLKGSDPTGHLMIGRCGRPNARSGS